MSLISKQIDELRAYAKDRKGELAKLINDAADTIEILSAKLHASNMERSSQYYNDGWIPCSERLPEENGQYLITVKYEYEAGYDDIYVEHGDWSDGEWDMFCFEHCGKVESIIAWMPLPDPFRKEGDE